MGELFVCPDKLKENAEKLAEMSAFVSKRNQSLKNIGQSLKNQAAYGNIAEIIFSLGEELADISKNMDEMGEVLELSAREYEKTEKKITDAGKKRKEKVLKNGSDGNPVGDMKNGWLQLYDGPTVDQDGRQVTMPGGNNPNKWAMREGLDTINKYARMAIEGTNTVVQGPNGALVDSEGRYWVAVGPNVMNPNHEGGQACSAAEMKYGTQIDVVVTDGKGLGDYAIESMVVYD